MTDRQLICLMTASLLSGRDIIDAGTINMAMGQAAQIMVAFDGAQGTTGTFNSTEFGGGQ